MNINQLMAENIIEEAPVASQEVKIELENTIVVKDKTYKIKPLKWGDAIDLWENILKVILPSLGSGADFMMQADGESEVNIDSVFSKAAMQLSKNLNGNSLSNFSRVLLHGATVDGVVFDIEKEFTQNYAAWLKVFVFALKVNYSSFFAEGLGVMDVVKTLANQQ